MVYFEEPLEPEEEEMSGTRNEAPEGSGENPRADEDLSAAMEGWTEALRAVQKSIDEAAEAIRFLRRTMQEMAPLWQSLGNLEDALRGTEQGAPEQRPLERPVSQRAATLPAPPALEEEAEEETEATLDAGTTPTQAPAQPPQDEEWQSFKRRPQKRERPASWREQPEESPASPVAMEPRAALKPVTLVPDDTIAPYSYRMTIEEPGSPVGLVPLHQALSGVAAIRNLSLIGYINGVASIAVEATEELSATDVEQAINKTMKQECSVITHDESTLLVQIGDRARSH